MTPPCSSKMRAPGPARGPAQRLRKWGCARFRYPPLPRPADIIGDPVEAPTASILFRTAMVRRLGAGRVQWF